MLTITRLRQFVLAVSAWCSITAGSPAEDPRCGASVDTVSAVASIGMTVSDLDRSLTFYTQVLDFRPVTEIEVAGDAWERFTGVFALRMRVAILALGNERLELTQYLAPEGRPIPPDSRSNDRWFQHIAIITPDMDRAYDRLRARNVRHASSGPQTLPDWNPSAGGIRAFYFKDPDGHVLEILDFPEDKGDPKWHKIAASEPDRLFLGIDHTAIVVADTEASLAFYRDRLGMRIAGMSENHGPEQERLNSVFGARLRITALRAATGAGPGVELLEYLAPADGRPMPLDTRACDLWHWHIRFIAVLPATASEVIALPSDLGFLRGIQSRDPDGHVVQIVEDSSPAIGESP